MAKVIDRLRVQGVSPTRENTFVSRETTIAPVVPGSDPDKQWVAHGDSFFMSGKQNSSKEFLATGANSAARRMEVLLRMRTANQGLSSMDSHFSLTPLQFVLRGTTVKNNLGSRQVTVDMTKLLPTRSVPRQRPVTHDGYTDRQIKVHIGKAQSEPMATVPEPVPSTRDDISLPPFSSPNFMLGPAQAPSYGGGGACSGKKLCRSTDGFELTGHRLKAFESNPSRIGYGEVYPHIDIPVRTQRRWTRNAFKESQSASTNPESLNQCLHVHQSITLPLGTHDEEIKLKHFTQFVRKDVKTSYNNPYRKIKKRERKIIKKNDRQYQFDSVASYVHFNRIYQQPTVGRSIAVHVPQLTGFPAHCTDTVLLRMMIEMNRPTRKSPDKYSDIAVHKDLDEFLVVRTPSAFSKTGSSKKAGVRSGSKSGQSNVDTAIEEEAGCAWAGARVQELKSGDELEQYEDQEQEAVTEKQPDDGVELEAAPPEEQNKDEPNFDDVNDKEACEHPDEDN